MNTTITSKRARQITTDSNRHQNYDVRLSMYSEPEAIQELLATVDELLKQAEANDYADDYQMQITIGGRTVAFILGGPQTNALYQFCANIAYENFYDIDTDSNTVTVGW